MIIKFEDEKLRENDLSTLYKDYLIECAIEQMKNDNEYILELITQVQEDSDRLLSQKEIDDRLELLLEEKAQEALDRMKIYCAFEIEVK